MHKIKIMLKSGREIEFFCESYNISTFKLDGSVSSFDYNGAIGEVPIYVNWDDVVCITEIVPEESEAEE